jgi:NADH-quinone oxidoreductase subunit L
MSSVNGVGSLGALAELLPKALDVVPAALHASVTVVALVASLRTRTPERLLARLSLVMSTLALLVAAVVGARVAVLGPARLDLGAWFNVGHYRFPILFLLDAHGVATMLLGCGVVAIAARFTATYLHKDPGFARFLGLIHLAAAGHLTVATGGTLDIIFMGWELLGLASVLLVAFFQDRDAPVRNAFRALVTYRACDIGLLMAAVLVHFSHASPDISLCMPALAGSPAASLIGAGLILAAAGKSAQVPLGGWLPRAMEGPTPSSALFYGALSIHAGVLLLLRSFPLLEPHPVLRTVVVVMGLLTAVVGSVSGQAAADTKNALAYAAMAQAGLMVAEVGLGLTTLAVVHMVGHALLRMGQFLRAPSALHDAHALSSGAGGELPPLGGWLSTLPPRVQTRLYALSVVEFHLDGLLQRAVVGPVVGLARVLDRVDRRLTRQPADPQG